MTKPDPSHNSLRASVLRTQGLLSLAQRLPAPRVPEPSRAEVVDALAGWLQAVNGHAARLEAELGELAGPHVDPILLGARVWIASLPGSTGRSSVLPGAGDVSMLLMQRMALQQRQDTPTVWLLGRLGSDGIEIYEQYTAGTPDGTEPHTFDDVKGSWVPRKDGVWQRLWYAGAGDQSFEVCLYWYGDEEVTVCSGAESWPGETWNGENGEVGTVFCKTFGFANILGRVVTVEVKLADGTTKSFVVRIDNPKAGDSDKALPEPILVPPEPTDPPEGTGPIVIPSDFASLPGVDPRTRDRVLDAFARFQANVRRSFPPVIAETITPALLQGRPDAVDHLLIAAAAVLEPSP